MYKFFYAINTQFKYTLCLYIGLFEILKRIGPVAYRLRLPQELNNMHDVFHVSNLKKFLSGDTLVIPLDEIKINSKLNFIE